VSRIHPHYQRIYAPPGRELQGFKVRLGQQAGQLYEQLYGKKRSRKVRTHLMARTSRNMVRTYPCGILEQAYRALVSEGHVATSEGAVPYLSPTGIL
jgi:hypothetical protein